MHENLMHKQDEIQDGDMEKVMTDSKKSWFSEFRPTGYSMDEICGSSSGVMIPALQGLGIGGMPALQGLGVPGMPASSPALSSGGRGAPSAGDSGTTALAAEHEGGEDAGLFRPTCRAPVFGL